MHILDTKLIEISYKVAHGGGSLSPKVKIYRYEYMGHAMYRFIADVGIFVIITDGRDAEVDSFGSTFLFLALSTCIDYKWD